ncbi:very short patch repair endonuclease, partial [Pseudoroseomonas ludipueritiae]|uniref:very short patch repair endonuclease n=1 Tax=Pseudoroseomonas ludipueritiae TaxID=198093 RepID=UPI003462417B
MDRQPKATDWPDVPAARRRTMRAIKGKNTKPELLLRSMLHKAGYRFRLHRKDLPGRPDITFPSRHRVIEVRGCWWHRHADCRHCTTPRTRQEYWLPKFARNQARDAANEAALRALGWDVLVVWECELADAERLLNRVVRFLHLGE